MNIAWVETRRGNNRGHRNTNPNTEISAGLRYARRLSNILNADLITDAAMLEFYKNKNYDVIIVGYSTAYQEFRKEAAFIDNQKSAIIVHITTEYGNACPASIFYAKRPFMQISNVETVPSGQIGGAWKYRDRYEHLNLNLLFFTPQHSIIIKRDNKAIYYGRYREDRSKYLMLLNGSGVMVSTAPKNKPKWINDGITDVTYVNKLDWTPGRETLRLFMYSIYFEDTYTHTNYNCPANRYYEALSVDTLPLIHTSCRRTFERAGIIPNKDIWFETKEDLKKKIASRDLYDKNIRWIEAEKERICNEKDIFIDAIKYLLLDYQGHQGAAQDT